MFVYENITNLARREEIRLAHGYCSIHTTIFMGGYGRLLSLATIEQDILNDVLRRIEHATRNPAKGGSLVGAVLHTFRNAIRGALLPSRQCPLCDYERSYEKVILGTLIQYIDNPAMAEAFASAALLCLPHYYVALGMRGIPGISAKLDKIIAREQRGLKQLKAEVDEYVRKRNTLYQDEEMIQEADAPASAARIIGGRIVHSDGRW
jgi:hypothetical protein